MDKEPEALEVMSVLDTSQQESGRRARLWPTATAKPSEKIFKLSPVFAKSERKGQVSSGHQESLNKTDLNKT